MNFSIRQLVGTSSFQTQKFYVLLGNLPPPTLCLLSQHLRPFLNPLHGAAGSAPACPSTTLTEAVPQHLARPGPGLGLPISYQEWLWQDHRKQTLVITATAVWLCLQPSFSLGPTSWVMHMCRAQANVSDSSLKCESLLGPAASSFQLLGSCFFLS